MFFIEGIRLGVMPLGENIGATLPAKAGMAMILYGRVPAGDDRDVRRARGGGADRAGRRRQVRDGPDAVGLPEQPDTLILLLAAAGVGIGAINGIVRFVSNKSLKVTIMPGPRHLRRPDRDRRVRQERA